MTVKENLAFALKRRQAKDKSKNETEKMVKEALANVGLPKAIDMMPAELSGGMQKRIGLARCLILNPEILLYDEPTTGLDPITGGEISELMLKMQKKYHATSLLISHDVECARITTTRILILVDGAIYAEGSYDELKKSGDKKVKQFFER